MMNDYKSLEYNAWRDSEAYQVPVTDEGAKLAEQRYRGFRKGWEYAMFYMKHNRIDRHYFEQGNGNERTN
jgi:hypothetical protein